MRSLTIHRRKLLTWKHVLGVSIYSMFHFHNQSAYRGSVSEGAKIDYSSEGTEKFQAAAGIEPASLELTCTFSTA